MSWRYALLIIVSVLSIIGAAFVIQIIEDGAAPILVLLGLIALFSTGLLAILPTQKWLAVIWSLLCLLLGLIAQYGNFFPVYISIGIGFSYLFFLIKQRSDNQLRFSFLEAFIPGMKGFLLFLALAMAFGIYQGVPSERIENTIRSGIAQFQIRDIPFFGRFAQPLLSMEEGDFLGPLVDRFAQPQIAAQCQGDERCEELIKQSLREELQKSLASGSESPENMAVEQEVKGFLSKQFDAFREKVNLGVAAAGIFLLIFLPFIGIFGWVLSLICYMFFLLLRLAGFFHVVEHSTVQKRIE